MEFRFSIFLMGMPITPNIIQTMKQTVKAKVLTMSTDQAWRVRWGLAPWGRVSLTIALFLSFVWEVSSALPRVLPILR